MLRSISLISIMALVFALPRSSAFAQEAGTISGRVLDTSTGRPVIGASVRPVGLDAGDDTDLDGTFIIRNVPAGTYELRITAPLYTVSKLTGVVVEKGKEARINAILTPKVDTGIEVVEITADVTESSEATQLLKRRMAPTVSDNLGAESIAKTPDSNAAEVVTRVPAVTIKDDKFIVVRGLNERYSGAILNRSRMPSTDPNKRVVPLDLFPADFVESLSIIKSYQPDLPGDFAGGLVDIQLKSPPQEWTASVSVSTSVNTETTFGKFNTYDSCWEDWFGFGDACRELPGNFPDQLQSLDLTTPQMRSLVASLPENWNLETRKAPPSFGIDGSFGGAVGPFSFNLAAIYNTSHQRLVDDLVRGFPNRTELDRDGGDTFVYDRSTFETRLGAIFTSELRISHEHKLSARALYNRKSEDEVPDGKVTT
jgi:hypothetical protein